MRIDPHVHCRDGTQRHKETIEHVFKIADEQGIDKIFDMPNTEPPIIDEVDVIKRLQLVPEERKEDYYLYLGATSDESQLRNAVDVFDKFDNVIGIKLFAGKSVGDLEIVSEKDQKKVYQTLADAGYEGVLAVHCEKESEMELDSWDPKKPITHCFVRPAIAEIKSVEDQIKFAKETNFKGTLHIVHASTPQTIDLVDEARKDMNITCAVTPHHIQYTCKDMIADKWRGLILKMNPPLRLSITVEGLRQKLKEGKVDWIETDHAPHQLGEKLYPPYMSGYPSMFEYKEFVEEFLPNLEVNEELIKAMTCDNIVKTFGISHS